jgi:hypothetical protein
MASKRRRKPFEIIGLKAICRARFANQVVEEFELDMGKDARKFQATIENTLLDGIRQVFLDAPVRLAIGQALRRSIITLGEIRIDNAHRAERLIREAVDSALRAQLTTPTADS